MAHISRHLAAVIDRLAREPKSKQWCPPFINSVEGFFMELDLGNDQNVCF